MPHVSTVTVFSGVMPFMVADIIRPAILIASVAQPLAAEHDEVGLSDSSREERLMSRLA